MLGGPKGAYVISGVEDFLTCLGELQWKYFGFKITQLFIIFRDFSRFSEEWQLFDVGRFEGVTFLRPSDVCPKLRMFGGLDGVRAPRHGPCNCAQNTPTGP